eukprot:2081852-Rhodomonas_salina.1
MRQREKPRKHMNVRQRENQHRNNGSVVHLLRARLRRSEGRAARRGRNWGFESAWLRELKDDT